MVHIVLHYGPYTNSFCQFITLILHWDLFLESPQNCMIYTNTRLTSLIHLHRFTLHYFYMPYCFSAAKNPHFIQFQLQTLHFPNASNDEIWLMSLMFRLWCYQNVFQKLVFWCLYNKLRMCWVLSILYPSYNTLENWWLYFRFIIIKYSIWLTALCLTFALYHDWITSLNIFNNTSFNFR